MISALLQDEVALSPEPILAAAENFAGVWVDLDRSLEIDAATFARRRKALSAALAAHGLGRGDRIVMAIGNGPLFPTVLTAILERGGSPLVVHCETPPAELLRTAARFAARFIARDSGPASELTAFTPHVATISGEPWERVLWAELRGDASRLGLAGPISDSNGSEGSAVRLAGVPLHPTSGTTGHPRIAVRPGAAAMAEARHWVEAVGIDQDDVILAIPPMSHAYAYGACVMTPLLTSARLLTMRRFSPRRVFQALEEYPVTLMPTVPVTLDVLMFGVGDRFRRRGLRVITAGSPLPQRTGARFKEISGISVRPLYGATETGIIAIVPPDFDAPPGCVGLPIGDVEVAVRTPPVAAELAEGVGTVYVRSSSMMAGYVSEGAVDDSPLAGGWFRTGDLGRFDAAGMLHLLGRETDVINVCGMKVVPSEVEEVIGAVAGVVEVKVYAGQRADTQYVKAAVVGAADLDLAAIRAHCEKQLVYYKRPEKYYVLQQLPRTPSGKIIRPQLP